MRTGKTKRTSLLALLVPLQGAMRQQVTGRAGGIACGKSRNKGGTRYLRSPLIGREAEIRKLLSECRTMTAIAEKMGISRPTLRKHLDLMGISMDNKHKEKE